MGSGNRKRRNGQENLWISGSGDRNVDLEVDPGIFWKQEQEKQECPELGNGVRRAGKPNPWIWRGNEDLGLDPGI